MILGVGIDVVDVARFGAALERKARVITELIHQWVVEAEPATAVG